MGQTIISQFERAYALPIESARQVANAGIRDAIVSGVRWEGMLVYSIADAQTYELRGGITNSDWQIFAGGLSDAPNDGNEYVRKNQAWALASSGMIDAPIDGSKYGRLNGAWTTINDATWGTILGTLSSQTDLQTALDLKLADAPSDGSWYARINGAWTTFAPGGTLAWGNITGTLSNQADLQSALNGKSATGHTHTTTDITNLSAYTGFDARYYTETELDSQASGYELSANKGTAGGYAPLNGSAKIDSAYLPSYVDDVLEYANFASFPGTGETGKIYVDLATNLLWRWSGSAYAQVGGGSVVWGAVTGTLSNQTDLQNALDGKTDTGHTHLIANITDFTDNSANWDSAFSWGDHALAGYLTSEGQTLSWTDATNTMAITSGNSVVITGFADTVHNHTISQVTDFTDNSTNWNTAFSWGDHVGLYSVTSHAHAIAEITGFTDNSSNWELAFSWGNHASAGYLTSQTDSQTLSWTDGTNNLAISGGNNVTITGFADTTHTHLEADITDLGDYVTKDTLQTITGDKTFSGDIFWDSTGELRFSGGTLPTNTAGSGSIGLDNTNAYYYFQKTGSTIFARHNIGSLTATRIYTWPDTGGTVALEGGAPTAHTHLIADITDANDTNWDTAFGWGNHASAGYLTTAHVDAYTKTESDAKYLLDTTDTLTGILTATTGVQTKYIGLDQGASQGDATQVFTDVSATTQSLVMVSNTTASTGYPTAFGNGAFFKGAGTSRDMALWRTNGAGDNRLYSGNWSAGGTAWDWYEIWHSGSDGSGSGLDADTLRTYAPTSLSTGSTIALRDSAGDVHARLFRSEYDVNNGTIGHIMTQIDTVSNNYLRPTTPTTFRAGVTDFYYAKAGARTDNYVWLRRNSAGNSVFYVTQQNASGHIASFRQGAGDGSEVMAIQNDGTISAPYIKIGAGAVNPIQSIGSGTGSANVNYWSWYESNGTTREGYIGFGSGSFDHLYLVNDNSSTYMYLDGAGGINGFKYNDGAGARTVWHAGNDGSGSGLDADTLRTFAPSTSATANTIALRNSSGYLFSTYFNSSGSFSTSGANSGMARIIGTNGTDTYARSYSVTGLITLLNTGSGLDADKLNGRSDTASGNRWDCNTYVVNNGVMEIGKYLDWHNTDADTTDYTMRFENVTSGTALTQLKLTGTQADKSILVSHSTADYGLLGANANGGYLLLHDGTTQTNISGFANSDFTYTITAPDFITSSDKRLKENIKPYQAKPMEVKWSTFNFKTDKGKRSTLGTIAQELEKKHPEFVLTDEKTGFKSVAYTGLLIAKMAEKDQQITELTERLEVLEKFFKKLL